MDGANLARYVKSVMDSKGITKTDIEKRSNKMVTDSHVAYILEGKAKNPTLKVLLGLAKGMEVDPIDVFKAAANIPQTAALTTYTLSELIKKLVHDDELADMVMKLSQEKPAKIKAVKKILDKG